MPDAPLGGRRLSVCVVVPNLEIGGAERQIAAVLPHLVGDIEVRVLTLLGNGPLADPLRAAGVPVQTLGARDRPRQVALPLRLRRHLTRTSPDIVHSHIGEANVVTRLACPRGVGHIETAHSFQEFGRAGERLLRLTRGRPDLSTHVSEAGLAAYRRRRLVMRTASTWTPNGVDTAAFAFDPGRRRRFRLRHGIPLGQAVVGFAGRLVPVKNPRLLLQAWSRLGADGPMLALAGDGPLRAELTDLRHELKGEADVRFLGAVDDMPSFMSAIDLLVLPSRVEGFPLVALEAVAAGLGVVASDIRPLRALSAEFRSHMTLAAARPDALADAVTAGLETPRDRTAPLPAGLARYELRGVAERWAALYAQLAGARS